MYQPPQVTFDTPNQKLAITGSAEDIYPHLGIHKHGRQTSKDPEAVCFDIRVYPESQQPENFTRRPEGLPFTSSGVQAFISEGLPLVGGRWSIRWASDCKPRHEKVYEDEFRAVFVFRTLEFSIRPFAVVEGPAPKQVLISTKDIERCLTVALGTASGEEMKPVIGTASADVAEDGRLKNRPLTRVIFQWRIDRADKTKVDREVKSWRVTQFGKKNPGAYEQKKNEYNFSLKLQERQNNPPARDEAAPRPEPFAEPYNQASRGDQGRKRPGSRSGTPGPSNKRRSTDFPDLSRSSTVATSGSTYQQQPLKYPGPSGMLVGAPLGAGYSAGTPYGQPPISSAGASSRSASSQPAMTAVTRGMSGMAITAPAPAPAAGGGYRGQNPPPPPPQTNYGPPAPRPVPVQMRHPQPAPGQYEGYGPPPQQRPSQGYPPQGSTSGGQYNTPPYSQGYTGGGNTQQGSRGGYPQQPQYPYQSGPTAAGSQSGRGGSSSRDDPRAGSSRDDPRSGRGHHSSSKHSHHRDKGGHRRG